MNSEICFDACRNIYGKSSSTFWGIFIKIPKLIPRVATLVYILNAVGTRELHVYSISCVRLHPLYALMGHVPEVPSLPVWLEIYTNTVTKLDLE